jgi:hypothetical protein
MNQYGEEEICIHDFGGENSEETALKKQALTEE